jgi:hypothetical protein
MEQSTDYNNKSLAYQGNGTEEKQTRKTELQSVAARLKEGSPALN